MLDSQTSYWLVLITAIGSAIISGLIALIIAFKVEKKKNRPQITAHGCRISDYQVYSYFDENNNTSSPACAFLSKDGLDQCRYVINNNDKKKGEKERMLEINQSKCYLTLWIKKLKNK